MQIHNGPKKWNTRIRGPGESCCEMFQTVFDRDEFATILGERLKPAVVRVGGGGLEASFVRDAYTLIVADAACTVDDRYSGSGGKRIARGGVFKS